MQDERHGVHSLASSNPEEDSPAIEDSEGDGTDHIDCKEAPGSGCKSAERLRMIREGKRPILEQRDVRSPISHRDSTNWYNFCGTEVLCMHSAEITGALVQPEAAEDMVTTHVWVPRPALGFSPRVGATNKLLGEVLRDFNMLLLGCRC